MNFFSIKHAKIRAWELLSATLAGLLLTSLAQAIPPPLPIEYATVEKLSNYEDQGWFWIYGSRAPNMTDSRAFLFDESGKHLGQLSTGHWLNSLLPLHRSGELVTVETYLSRGTRGERTDLVVVYDATTLDVNHEIDIPPKRMHALTNAGLAVVSDDERFMLVLNYTPAQSISVVDLQNHSFVGEFETPGCSSIYSGGNRDFFSICGDGGFLHTRLDEQGMVDFSQRTEPLFDPIYNFVSTSASRIGNTWYFVTIESDVLSFVMDERGVSKGDEWSLVTAEEREEDWRISGANNTAAHSDSGRLYVLMHEGGGRDSYNEPGTHIWIFDTSTGQRIGTAELHDLGLGIAVSQGPNPRLYSVGLEVHLPILTQLWIYFREGESALMSYLRYVTTIYDGTTGDHIRTIGEIPDGYLNAVLPW